MERDAWAWDGKERGWARCGGGTGEVVCVCVGVGIPYRPPARPSPPQSAGVFVCVCQFSFRLGAFLFQISGFYTFHPKTETHPRPSPLYLLSGQKPSIPATAGFFYVRSSIT